MDQLRKRQFVIWEFPEMLSGVLILFSILWELGFLRTAVLPDEQLTFLLSTHVIVCWMVWFNTAVVLVHVMITWWRNKRREVPLFLIWQLLVGLAASSCFSLCVHYIESSETTAFFYWASVMLGLMIGVFSIINIFSWIAQRRASKIKPTASKWSPAVIFFTSMLSFILVSTILLLTPGATYERIGIIDAFFMCSSATAITGLSTLDIERVFTPFGLGVILMNIQIGALGVMTFSYFVMIMIGKKLAVQDKATFSGILDQQGVNIVPTLLKIVISVTIIVEALGAVALYLVWKDIPEMQSYNLAAVAIFHSVSAFCNAGISTFSANMAVPFMEELRLCQFIMMLIMFAGTVGFGVYLESLARLKNRLTGKRSNLRWSTHCWLVMRVSAIVILGGAVLLALLAIIEPSDQSARSWFSLSWEALWNAIGRSAGFNLSDLNDYGPAYKMLLCVLMFIGGNPAGTGGGVFAPVVALCVLEIYRVLRGREDLEIHQRRIARATVNRAMCTVVLSMIWIVIMTMLIVILEPDIAKHDNGVLRILFEEISAYTTTGYSLGITSELTGASKMVLAFSMIFGRVGMFTFMMIFIRQGDQQLLRYPETRLPLS